MPVNRLFLLAGDYSGDMHAAKVVKALRETQPEIVLAAVGGAHLKAMGVEMLSDQSQMGRIGFGAILGAWYHYHLGRKILSFLADFKPDAVLLIDYGGFNLYMASLLKKRGVRVFYFIPPQVWASRKGRIHKIKANVDHVFCIFPFEQALYESYGVPVTYVGHPLIGELPPPPSRETFCQGLGLNPQRPIVALMPGSRKLEIDYLLKAILGSMPLIRHHYPQAQFVLAQAGSLGDDYFLPRFQALWQATSKVPTAEGNASRTASPPVILKNQNHALLGVADLMIAASGTVTLEGALYDTPMVLMYKLHPLVYAIVLRLIYLPCMGLPNILTDVHHPIVPELWQNQVNPSAIAHAVLPLFEPGSVQTLRQRNGFAKIRQELNTGGAAENVAKGILTLING
jgi:lipid-A-disaccharide synthase